MDENIKQENAQIVKQENDQNVKPEKPKKKSFVKVIIIIACMLLVTFMLIVFGIAGAFIFFKNKSDKNQLIANEVIAMIDMLDDKEITPEDESDINKVKNKYDNLTDNQKKLVTNSKVLDQVIGELEEAKKNIGKTQDQEAAADVIKLIEALNGKTVTVDSESEITLVKMQYDALTEEQKALVLNYGILETAMDKLQDAKDLEAAEELMLAIDSIDVDSLGTDSTELNKLFAQYEALTESQKNLVTNYYKLEAYQEIIKTNTTKQEQIDAGMNLANNFPGFRGKWGDFGAHINYYQGMIETVIKRDANLRGYFECNPDPNYLQMYVSRFTKDTSGFGIGRCSVTFTGINKNYGYTSIMYGEVIIKNDGSLYFTMTYFD